MLVAHGPCTARGYDCKSAFVFPCPALWSAWSPLLRCPRVLVCHRTGRFGSRGPGFNAPVSSWPRIDATSEGWRWFRF